MTMTASLLATVGLGAEMSVDIDLTGIVPDATATVLEVCVT